MWAPGLLPMSRLRPTAKGFADGSDIKIGRSSWIAQVSPGESPGPSKVERKAELGRRDTRWQEKGSVLPQVRFRDGATCKDEGGASREQGPWSCSCLMSLETTVP